MTTFVTMVNRIAQELKRLDLMDHIEEAVRSAITDFESDPFVFNLARFRIDTVANQESYTLPTDLKTAAGAAITAGEDLLTIDSVVNRTGAGPATYLRQSTFPMLELYFASAAAATPLFWARLGAEFRVGPKPSGILNIYLTGVKQLVPVSLTVSNAWMTDGEKLIRSRSKVILGRDVLRDATIMQAAKAAEDEAYADLKRQLAASLVQPWQQPTPPRAADTQVRVNG